MAKYRELDDAAFDAWLAERPPIIQEMGKKYRPNILYRMQGLDGLPGTRGYIDAYCEDGTVKMVVDGQFNLVSFARRVFGIDPATLTECDLPTEGERLGEMFTQVEALEHINEMRALNGLPPYGEQDGTTEHGGRGEGAAK